MVVARAGVKELGALYEPSLKSPDAVPDSPSSMPTSSAGSGNGCAARISKKQLAYWKSSWEANSRAELPTDRPRRRGRPSPGAIESLSYPRVTRELKECVSVRCHDVYALSGGLQILPKPLHGAGGYPRGRPVRQPQPVEVEGPHRLFASTSPVLRTRPLRSPTFGKCSAIREVARSLRGSYLPFDKLSRSCNWIGNGAVARCRKSCSSSRRPSWQPSNSPV